VVFEALPSNWGKQVRKAIRGTLRYSMKGAKRGPHLTRYVMYRELKKLRKLMPAGPTLAISRSQPLCKALGLDLDEVTPADYPEYSLFKLPFEEGQFQNIVSDQVLEHLEGNPQEAIDEGFRVIAPGGVAVHTTCFMNPVHEYPADYWRFTPEALKLLCRNYEIIAVGGWGNKYAFVAEDLGLRFDKVPHSKKYWLHRVATENDPKWPIVTWVAARKPG
jgi:SAM-dependent methyltransferase